MRHILITSRDEGHERLCITRYRSADFAGGISLMFRQSSAFPRIAVTNSNLRNYVEGGREGGEEKTKRTRTRRFLRYVCFSTMYMEKKLHTSKANLYNFTFKEVFHESTRLRELRLLLPVHLCTNERVRTCIRLPISLSLSRLPRK